MMMVMVVVTMMMVVKVVMLVVVGILLMVTVEVVVMVLGGVVVMMSMVAVGCTLYGGNNIPHMARSTQDHNTENIIGINNTNNIYIYIRYSV